MKTIPSQLLSHLQEYATTWCYLMKVQCVGKYAGTTFGFTSLDVPVDYDDGEGSIQYSSSDGFMPSKFQKASDFDVDNADITGYIQDSGITQADILSGIFDSAKVTIYRINYMKTAAGHEVVDYGVFGATQFIDKSWKNEFRSLMQIAKQTFGPLWSLGCRATYGDSRCGMEYEWVDGTVTSVGDDSMLEFYDTSLGQTDGYYAPGVIEWVTGNNAGAEMDVDAYVADTGYVRLTLEMQLTIAEGDTYRLRRDCDKTFATCKARGNYLQFRGEHLTPVANTGLMTPGAYVSTKS